MENYADNATGGGWFLFRPPMAATRAQRDWGNIGPHPVLGFRRLGRPPPKLCQAAGDLRDKGSRIGVAYCSPNNRWGEAAERSNVVDQRQEDRMIREEAVRGKPGRKSRDDDLRAKLEILLAEIGATPVPSPMREQAEELQKALDARRGR